MLKKLIVENYTAVQILTRKQVLSRNLIQLSLCCFT